MICPVTEYVLVAGAHAEGMPVNPVMLHKMAQLVVPVPPDCVAEMLQAVLEKLVTITIYHCPATAPTMFTNSVAEVE